MNIKKYIGLESDLAMARIELKDRFIELVNDEFGVQFDGVVNGSILSLKLSDKNYSHANYDFKDSESFRNDYLTLDQVKRFVKIIHKLEEVK